ncbi:MAG: caspase family protein [Prosthecobacter sp.]
MIRSLVLSIILCLLACPAWAKRVALVVGVNSYRELSAGHQLTSPVNDARDVAAALQKIGYSLVSGGAVTETSRDALVSATEEFAVEARGAEAAVFYFSGHGVQVGEDNYLLPGDMPKLSGPSILDNRAVLLRSSVMVALEGADVKTKVVILDCCRDNPFAARLESTRIAQGKGIRTKSLGEITGYGPGFYLAFATSPGQTAADGNGQRNSTFTAAFLRALPVKAGEDIDFFFRHVKSLLPRDQVSWTNHSITERFVLAPEVAARVPTESPPAAPVVVGPAPVVAPPPPPRTMASALATSRDELPADAPPPPVTRITTLSVPSAKAAERLERLFSISPYADYDIRQQGEILKLVQEKLAESEFDPGSPDGVPGDRSQAALNSWQRRHNLHTTTKIDHETLNRMGLMGIARVTYPAAPAPVVAPPSNPPVTRQPSPPATAPVRTMPRPPASNGNRDMSIEEFERRAKALQRR